MLKGTGFGMADRFRSNPQVAGEMSRQLSQIRADVASLGDAIDQSGAGTGSPRIQDALHQFFADSSDSRGKLDQLLERAAGMLAGLAEGTTVLDQGLSDALEPQQAPA